MRKSRRAGLLRTKAPTLVELFKNLNILACNSVGTTGTATPSLDVSAISTATYYALLLTGKSLNIAKVTGSSISKLLYNTTDLPMVIEDGQLSVDTSARGYYLLAASFPNYSTQIVDAVFTNAGSSRIASKEQTGTARTGINKSAFTAGHLCLAFVGTTYSSAPNRAFFYAAESSSFLTRIISRNQDNNLNYSIYFDNGDSYLVDYTGGTTWKPCNAQGVFQLEDG